MVIIEELDTSTTEHNVCHDMKNDDGCFEDHVIIRLKKYINTMFISEVHAACKEEHIPPKPPKMKYKDLPYECDSHHAQYNEYLENKHKCRDHNKRMLHAYFLPTVKDTRKNAQKSYRSMRNLKKKITTEIPRDLKVAQQKICSYFQDDEKLMLRRAIVTLGAITGFVYGSPKNNYFYRKLFFGGVGAVSTGFLCFPKGTDAALRNISYNVANRTLPLVNWWFETDYHMSKVNCLEPKYCPDPREKSFCDELIKKRKAELEAKQKEKAKIKRDAQCRRLKEERLMQERIIEKEESLRRKEEEKQALIRMLERKQKVLEEQQKKLEELRQKALERKQKKLETCQKHWAKEENPEPKKKKSGIISYVCSFLKK